MRQEKKARDEVRVLKFHRSGRALKAIERMQALILREVRNRGEVLSKGEM